MEDEFFLKKMQGVKPLKKNQRSALFNKKINNKDKKPVKPQQNKTSNTFINQKNSIEQNYEIEFGEINKQLKKGKIKIDRRVDLHGYSLIKAKEKLESEIIKCHSRNMRCILFVTGKGAVPKKEALDEYDEVPPKLFYGKIKNNIALWLREEKLSKYVLTYQNANHEQGGDGAIFVYLRKN